MIGEIKRSEKCGNSPKNIFVQEMSIALASGELAYLEARIDAQVRWRIVGQTEITSKDNLMGFLGSESTLDFKKLTIHQVVTHGKAGVVNGTVQFEDGSVREFCDVYEFTSAKGTSVKVITSYILLSVDSTGIL
jgi:hypothetical protein